MNYLKSLKTVLFILTLSIQSCMLSEMNDPCTINGKVTDSSGLGIENVTVQYNLKSNKLTESTLLSGDYTLDIPTGGPMIVSFSKEGYTTQTFNFVIEGGEKKKMDIKLRTLTEDAFLRLINNEITINNTGESFFLPVVTNVPFTFHTDSTWITCTSGLQGVQIKCDPNKSALERNVLVVFNGQYNLTDSLKIKQLAGPVSGVIHYLRKAAKVLK